MRPMSLARIALSLMVLAAGVAKFVAPLPGHAIPELAFQLFGGAESILALFLLRGMKTTVATLAIACMAFAGVVFALISNRPCGCYGSVYLLSQRQHLALASLVGLLAVIILHQSVRRTPSPLPDSSP